MAGKRNRRDSENSCGTPCAGKDHSPNRGTCSSSSGSIEDDSENLRKCCFPGVCPFGEDSAADESVMVKVICNSEACPLSQFMHAECFHQWEETILGHLRSHGRARSWSEKQRRQNLWTKRGYDLAYRACACSCRHGHLRKDLNWVASTPQQTVDVQDATGRKKNRRKHKDLPTLGGIKYGSLPMKTKSKPIPNKDSRMRHSSASSSVSVDQGYISESPGTGEAPYVFSPPSTRMHFSFHNVGQPRPSNGFGLHAPSTSPLPEVPDDVSSPLSPTSPTNQFSFTSPPMSPESIKQPPRNNNDVNELQVNEIQRIFPPTGAQNAQQDGDIEAMTKLIDELWRKQGTNNRSDLLQSPPRGFFQPDPVQPSLAPSDQMWFPQPTHSFPQENNWIEQAKNAQLLQAMRQKEQSEMAKRELNKMILDMMNMGENKTQVISIPHERGRSHSRTEIRLVPMRSTTFAKRYDFSAFQSVLPRQHINPYHIKMEGEGYGSDDLRNFILSSLSVAKCSQMNCVLCGVDLPVYDHFPLIDGTMFLSPEKNERSTKNCFKIKIEGKYEYVHAACIRCLGGMHNIVCRMCDVRWEGSHHQLGTLYMYDIFAANPCCQKRLCCKQCGGAVLDIRMGLKNFSDYSSQTTCPRCRATDHHFVKPVTSYQLMGVVYS